MPFRPLAHACQQASPRHRALVQGAGYTGYSEVEIFSQHDWWQRDPDEVLSTMKSRYATAC